MAEFDLERLASWMESCDSMAAQCTEPHVITAGTQNWMVSFARGGRRYVLRRPNPGALAGPARIVAREMRVLNALAGSDVPHPSPFGSCLNDDMMGGPFYVMEAIEGFNAIEGLPSAIEGNEEKQRRLGFAAVEALISLSKIDYVTANLHDLGKPDGFLRRQVARWQSLLESYEEFAGWALEGALARVGHVGDWLTRHLPAHNAIGLIHGDFHLGNMLFAPDGSSVAAIIDWELSTIGDPLIDLGWLLSTWPAPDGLDTGCGISVPGATALPSPADLARHYQTISGNSLAAIGWYQVLACYKLGIIQEGSWARSFVGRGDCDIGRLQHGRALAMIEKAEALISRAETTGTDREELT